MDIVEKLRGAHWADKIAHEAATEIERLNKESKRQKELLQHWLACCFVDTRNGSVSFGMGVKKVWSETHELLRKE
jgi:hypothetical protein